MIILPLGGHLYTGLCETDRALAKDKANRETVDAILLKMDRTQMQEIIDRKAAMAEQRRINERNDKKLEEMNRRNDVKFEKMQMLIYKAIEKE